MFKELSPRITILEELAKPLPEPVTCTPATFPDKSFRKFVELTLLKSF